MIPRAFLSTPVVKLLLTVGFILLITASFSIYMLANRYYYVSFVENVCLCEQKKSQIPLVTMVSGDDYLRIKDGDPLLKPTDPQLLEFIRRRLVAPSRLKVKPYNTTYKDYSQIGQSTFIDQLLGGKTNGFHLEVGAADGETMSNSLFFEVARNWTGLLIEANPYFYESMLRRNRQAYSINACLSPNNQTQALLFRPVGFIGGLKNNMDESHMKAVSKRAGGSEEEVLIQCYPIYSILLALGVTHIDYFSLDIEGPEVDILRTIPWHAVVINTFTIEFRMWNGEELDIEGSRQKLEEIRQIFRKTDLYEEVTLLPQWTGEGTRSRVESEPRALDIVFRRRDLEI